MAGASIHTDGRRPTLGTDEPAHRPHGEGHLCGRHRALRPRLVSVRLSDSPVNALMGYYPILDRAPKGRDEDDGFQLWLRRHDEYDG